MKRKISAIIFLLYFTSFLSLNAQWARTYGGSEDDYAFSIQQTIDGGYIVAGVTDSFGAGIGDFWILKLSSDGTIEWQKTYGQSHLDEAHSVQQTIDGGYIVGGMLAIMGWDIWVLKLSSDGDIEWQKSYEKSDVSKTTYSIQQTNDGGYIVAGETYDPNCDIYVLKLSLDGDIEWDNIYGRSGDDSAYSIQQTIDGGYIVVGETNSFGAGSADIWVLKLTSDGSVEWQKTYGGYASDGAYSVQQTIDGGYIVVGETNSFGAGSEDIWVLKLASDGSVEWQKTYGGSRREEASTIQQTSDGGYIVAGFTDTYGVGKQDFLILKLSSNGDIDPTCSFVNESNADVSDSSVSPADTYINPEETDVTSNVPNITPQESDALVYSLCSGQHTLSLSATSGGTTNPPPGTYVYDHAMRISIVAYPDEEYHFSEWSGDVSGLDNQLSLTMDSDKSVQANFVGYTVVWEEAKKTPCFIATAAYESPFHPHVRILRDFRDKYLLTNTFGLALVNLYYKYSPFAANLIEKNKGLKVVVRINLLPLVAICFSIVNFGPIVTGIMLFFLFAFPILFAWIFQKKISQKKSQSIEVPCYFKSEIR